jgi:hypothetical protein
MMPTDDPRFRELFEERGILPDHPEIVAERPYVPYHAGDIETLYAEDPKYRDELLPGQVLWIVRMVAQRDGVLMRRHAGLPDSPDPWAQIRPYRPKGDPGLVTQRWAHRHPWAFLHKHLRDSLPFEPDEVPYGSNGRESRLVTVGAGGGDYRIMPNPREDGGVKRKRMNSRRWLDDHERHHPKGPDKVPPELRADWERGRAEGWHPHFWPWDAHPANEDYEHEPEVRSKFHAHTEYAKYLYAPADPDRPESGKERSAGIDVHPLAEELLDRGGRRAFYAIEGVLKNDAILAQGVPVFDTGSVSCGSPMSCGCSPSSAYGRSRRSLSFRIATGRRTRRYPGRRTG